MRPPRIAAAVAVVLLGATTSRAVEVRQPATAPRYHADLVQAYAPCVAPNEVSVGGTPACSPPVQSACPFTGGTVDIEGVVDAPPTVRGYLGAATRPAGCPNGPYDLAVTLRVSGTPRQPNDDEAPPVPTCSTNACTYPDVVVHVPVILGSQPLNPTPLPVPGDVIDANYEILDVTVFGTDGVPVAAPGPSGFPEVTGANLTVPYEPCTTPDPDGSGIPCNRKPWTAVCDFDAGSVDWTQPKWFNPPRGHVTLEGVTGRSPLCTDGTYAVQATVRGTLESCGTVLGDFHLCTLVDRTIMIPVAVEGAGFDASGAIDLGAFVSQYRHTQISSVRLLDPTGAPLAATGVSAVRNLVATQVKIKKDQIRVRGVLPIEPDLVLPPVVLDPVLPYGMTLTVSDRDGIVYTAAIPGERWQLQPPIGSRWTYADKGGVLAGVRKARIKRIAKADVVTGYEVDLTAKGVDLSAADFPGMNVTITVARAPVPNFDTPSTYAAQRSRTCRVKPTSLSCR